MAASIVETIFDPNECRIPSQTETRDVAVDVGIYHDPSEIACTRGMQVVSESIAYYKHEAVPCSRCFDEQGVTSHPFPYLRDNI